MTLPATSDPRCNVCGSTNFTDVNGREAVLCSKCGSYERTRLMKLQIERLELDAHARILHLAPERGLSEWLSRRFPAYFPADYDLDRYSHIPGITRIDLCQREYGLAGPFDLILHSHVIEHLPVSYAAPLIRLHKMLSSNGHHLFSIPIYGTSYEESLAPLGEVEATRRFGQFDHVRRFSPVDIQQTIGSIFRIPLKLNLLECFKAQELRDARIPQDTWVGYNGNTVFCLRPEDLLV